MGKMKIKTFKFGDNEKGNRNAYIQRIWYKMVHGLHDTNNTKTKNKQNKHQHPKQQQQKKTTLHAS